MRFEKQMQRIALDLEIHHGMNVLQCVYSGPEIKLSDQDVETLSQAHYRKIDFSDGIYVVDIDGYVGESVRQEIDYARKRGKEVLFHSQY